MHANSRARNHDRKHVIFRPVVVGSNSFAVYGREIEPAASHPPSFLRQSSPTTRMASDEPCYND